MIKIIVNNNFDLNICCFLFKIVNNFWLLQ
jgi:hypothetical protein